MTSPRGSRLPAPGELTHPKQWPHLTPARSRATGSRACRANEVAAHIHIYRLAQANRLQRFCADNSLNAEDVMAGKIDVDLTPICGPDGKIEPEAIDIRSVQ